MDHIKLTTPFPGILHISLNRPEQLNALSHGVLTFLEKTLAEVKEDHSVKGLLLTGEGKGFCAGADIKQLASLDGPQGLQFAQYGQKVFNDLELLGKPSIACIHGFAFGGGCELAMAATLRLTAEKAVFGQPEIKLGVIPGFGGTQRLARLIGKGRALEICLTGRRVNAEEALHWGLVNEITPLDKLITRGLELLKEIIALPQVAISSICSTIHQGYNLTLEAGLALEAANFALCCSTADKKEGVDAFLNKRVAQFHGN